MPKEDAVKQPIVRRKIYDDEIRLLIESYKKSKFDQWCSQNNTDMSKEIRRFIDRRLEEFEKSLQANNSLSTKKNEHHED